MSNYKLAVEMAKGVGLGQQMTTNYSTNNVDETIRKAFLEEIGTDEITYSIYRENKPVIFRILEETVSPIMNDRLVETMGRFAEVRNIGWGDTTVFDVENPDLFEVAVIADGTTNLRRQRLDNGKMDVTMSNYGVAIYDEFYRFLAGRVNWAQMVDKVAKSYEKKMAEAVSAALFGSYDDIDDAFKYTGTFIEDDILEVLQQVEALYGDAILVGTKAALAKFKPDYVGDRDKEGYNAIGRLAVYRGYDMVELAQYVKAGTNELGLSTKDILVLPSTSDKFVKIVHEGSATIIDKQNDSDLTFEHTFIKRAGVGLSIAKHFGMLRISN